VLLRLEANCVNSSINSSERSQSKKARVFSEGEDEGFDSRAERTYDVLMSHPMASASREGKCRRMENHGTEGARRLTPVVKPTVCEAELPNICEREESELHETCGGM